MKNKIIKILSLLLLVCIVVPSTLIGCSSKGKTLIYLDDYEISTNLYQLMLSQQKGKMAYAIKSQYDDINSEKFWGMTIDMKTQKTNEEYYNEAVLQKAKNYLCAMKLFDELKDSKDDFKMPKSYIENIDDAIDDFIKNDAKGSKSKLNSILSEYGINIDMLREFLIMEAKASYVVDYLYGADGSKIGENVKNEYFKNNYVSCKQILIQKFTYIYEKDEDGNEIYYAQDTGDIIYDKTKTPGINSDGSFVLDKKGNRVYYNNDGSIAYDQKNGKRKVRIDPESGQEEYKMLDKEKLEELEKKAQDLTLDASKSGINGFDVLRRENSDDYVPNDATGGVMYYATNVDYATFTSAYLSKISNSLSEMEVGEVKMLESDLSYNIIIKTELEDGAYGNKLYENYFKDSAYGIFDFVFNLKNELYSNRLADYEKDVKVDEDLLYSLDLTIKTIAPNYYYPDPDIAYHHYDKLQ